ncbi:MAG: GAF domain-containing protein [Ktedonobacterales bacterium]|nr:GAF domain-containing protein [Ktedonobacterales bacterium]
MAANFSRMDVRSGEVGGNSGITPTASLQAVAANEATDRALRRILRNIISLLSASSGLLAVYDAASDELVLTQYVGTTAPTVARRILLHQGILGEVAATKTLIVSDSLAHDTRYRPTDGKRTGSLLCVPLQEEDEFFGIVAVASDRLHGFGARHVACAEALADAAVLVLARAVQTESATAERRQLQTLVDAARTITAVLDPREIFEHIAGGIAGIVPYDDALIFAFDQPPQELVVIASQGERSLHLCGRRVALSDGTSFTARIAQTRTAALYSPDRVAIRPGRLTEAFLAGEELALLGVPLLSKDQLRGVLTLARARPFRDDDQRVMSELAPILATALENIALYAAVRAEQAQKTQFLQIISHEISTPLHNLNGFLDLMLTGVAGALDEKQRPLAQRARVSGEQLATQVRDLIVLAYEDAGTLTMNMLLFDMGRMLKETFDAMDLVARDAGVTLSAALAPMLPPYFGDSERLSQAARNLLSNAIAHTPRGGQVWLETRVVNRMLEISVADTGCGIAPEHLPRIFERFYRVSADPSKGSGGGQGLGLAIVKAIVDRHGGRVQVQSMPGQGSRFTLMLPLHRSGDLNPPPGGLSAAPTLPRSERKAD